MAGLEILTGIGRLDSWGHHTYCGMKLIFDAVREMREHFNRSFNFVRDLYIRLPGRESRDERNVLPSDLGRTADGRGRKWSIQQLLKRGEEAATAIGITRPTTRQCISYGLLAGAQLNPLEISGKDLQLLVRMALYDLPQGESPPREMVDQVSDRILVAVQRHWHDGPAKFQKWFAGPHNNFLKTIAEQPNSPGGNLPREAVRRVFLDLGIEAYVYVAGCVEAFAKWFQKALPEKLTRAELQQFEQVFMRQHYLGGLPLVLVMERSEIIRDSIVNIWENPGDRQATRVLHRQLYFYTEMIANRRAADRRFKPKGSAKGSAQKYVKQLPYEVKQIASSRNDEFDLSRIIQHIRIQRGLPAHCDCCPLTVNQVKSTRRRAEFQCTCNCGRFDETLVLTEDDILGAACALGIV
ncbi:MAG TPA: hypothetical protein VGY55_20535 [Pirellulales bacterium]|nr:hypothetical protein [Pirellulales bacterium]